MKDFHAIALKECGFPKRNVLRECLIIKEFRFLCTNDESIMVQWLNTTNLLKEDNPDWSYMEHKTHHRTSYETVESTSYATSCDHLSHLLLLAERGNFSILSTLVPTKLKVNFLFIISIVYTCLLIISSVK